MRITLICSCGLVLEAGGKSLLIDVLTQELAPFYRAPQTLRRKIIEGAAPYDAVCGLLFTHLHPDHFDRLAAEAFAGNHENTPVYIPSRRVPVPGVLLFGPFCVELHRVRHTPVPGYGVSTVDAMIVSCEGKEVYIASDTAPDASIHASVLAGRSMDAAFWNGEMLLYPPEREALDVFAARNFIYHIPPDPTDGLRRKLERILARDTQAMKTVRLLEEYPSSITI